MLLDANLLLYACNAADPQHEVASQWLAEAISGPTRVGMPWASLHAFLRISTHPRVFPNPLTPDAAWRHVTDWLEQPNVWNPLPTDRRASVLGDLIRKHRVTGPLVSDAALAALATEHGLAVYSTDGDFARFSEISWVNPLSA